MMRFLALALLLGGLASSTRAQYGWFTPASQCFWDSYRGRCSIYNTSPYYPMYCRGSIYANTYRGFTYSSYGQSSVMPGMEIWAEVFVPNPYYDPATFAWHSIVCHY